MKYLNCGVFSILLQAIIVRIRYLIIMTGSDLVLSVFCYSDLFIDTCSGIRYLFYGYLSWLLRYLLLTNADIRYWPNSVMLSASCDTDEGIDDDCRYRYSPVLTDTYSVILTSTCGNDIVSLINTILTKIGVT